MTELSLKEAWPCHVSYFQSETLELKKLNHGRLHLFTVLSTETQHRSLCQDIMSLKLDLFTVNVTLLTSLEMFGTIYAFCYYFNLEIFSKPA